MTTIERLENICAEFNWPDTATVQCQMCSDVAGQFEVRVSVDLTELAELLSKQEKPPPWDQELAYMIQPIEPEHASDEARLRSEIAMLHSQVVDLAENGFPWGQVVGADREKNTLTIQLMGGTEQAGIGMFMRSW